MIQTLSIMWILFLLGLFCLLLVIGAFTQIGAFKFAAKSSVVLGAGAFLIFICFVTYVLIAPMLSKPAAPVATPYSAGNPFVASPSTGQGRMLTGAELGLTKPATTPAATKSSFELQADCKKEAQQAFYGDRYLKHEQWTFRSNWNVEEGKCFYSLFHHYMSADGSVVSVTEMIREAPQNTSYGQLSGIGSSTNGVSISCTKGKGATQSCSTLEAWRDYTQELMDWSYAIQL